MRFVVVLATLWFAFASTLAAPAHAAPKSPEDRARAALKRSVVLHHKAEKATSPTRRLALLDRELRVLRRANGILRMRQASEKDVPLAQEIERHLISALNAKTRIYMKRGSLTQALRSNRAALSYRTASTEALNLRYVLSRAARRDLIDEFEGLLGIQRLRARRTVIGQALRDRGNARRR